MLDSYDPRIIKQQYATDKHLLIRQKIHDKYTVPKTNYFKWVLDSAKWQGDEWVLDIGCASGSYYDPLLETHPDIKYFGMDLSMGMISKHPAKSYIGQGDVESVPFPDETFDVVMANHMLYHAINIDQAIIELKRVLKPGGVLITATNSTQSMPELQLLMRRAILLLARGGATQIEPPAPASDRFALENGCRQLAHHFYAVMRADLPSKLIFPEIEPVMDYLETTRSLREPQLPPDVNWDDVMMIMRQQVTHLVNHLGEMAINKLNGVLIATDNGDFIREFLDTKYRLDYDV